MKLLYWLANQILVAACLRGHLSFKKNLKEVYKTQENALLSIIRENAQSLYGREYGFSEITCVADFQERVPFSTYTDYLNYIEKICTGEPAVLTTEPVLLLELSSGSTSASKLIPYTKKLKDEFQHGITPWIYDLYTRNKGLSRGKAYWSITPVNIKKDRTLSGIPIGFEEDRQYFGFLEQRLLNFLSAVPKEVKDISDITVFRYVTLLFLIKEKHLTFVSVWNPSFFILLLKPLNTWLEGLINDLARGRITPPGRLSPDLRGTLEKKLGRNVKRADELRRFLNQNNVTDNSFYEDVWPNLKLISCWTDANAEISARELQTHFPKVLIQGKGLLATEGFVSFPLAREEGAILSIGSHFFEFIEYDPCESNSSEKNSLGNKSVSRVRLAHELEKGKSYSVALTTSGGFYRYKLHDLVKVIGFTEGCPRIKFMGKEDKISDYCGEKLNEFHVRQVIEKALQTFNINPKFYMLAPEISPRGTYHYVIYIQIEDKGVSQCKLNSLTNEIEEGLLGNFHYSYCRELGQLDRVKLFLIRSGDGHNGIETYHRVCLSFGQKAGDIKPTALHQKTGWVKEFPGEMIESKGGL